MNAEQKRARESTSGPTMEKLAERRGRERFEPKAIGRNRSEGAIAEWRPGRKQERHLLVAEPARRESQRRDRRSIEPLQIIDHHKSRPRASELGERTEEREPHRVRIDRRRAGLFEQECDGERPALRRRQSIQGSADLVTQKITKPSERECRLRLGRTRQENPPTQHTARLDTCVYERGLPDSSFAFEQQHARRPGEKLSNLCQLPVAPDNRVCALLMPSILQPGSPVLQAPWRSVATLLLPLLLVGARALALPQVGVAPGGSEAPCKATCFRGRGTHRSLHSVARIARLARLTLRRSVQSPPFSEPKAGRTGSSTRG
jgi:hypothetical protein